MSKTPFMPLWVSDFLGDTLDLDAQEIGAYMLILMAMWQREGTLPNDQKKIQRVARIGRGWPKVWASIEQYFEADGDTITNPRLTKELQKARNKSEVNATNGGRGGRAKALKTKERDLANAKRTLYQPETITRIDDDDTARERDPMLDQVVDAGRLNERSQGCLDPFLSVSITRWRNLGLLDQEILTVLRHASGRSRQGSINSPDYFDGPITEAAARKSAPQLVAAQPGPSAETPADFVQRAIAKSREGV